MNRIKLAQAPNGVWFAFQPVERWELDADISPSRSWDQILAEITQAYGADVIVEEDANTAE